MFGGVLAAESRMDGDAHGTERNIAGGLRRKRESGIWVAEGKERERMYLQVNRIKRKICLRFPSELPLPLFPSRFSSKANQLSQKQSLQTL